MINIYKYNYTLRLTFCQLCAKLVYMPKNRIFKITEGTETKEVEAILGYRGRPAIVHRDDMVLLR